MKTKLILIMLLVVPAITLKAQCFGRSGQMTNSLDFYYGYRSFSGNFYNQFNTTGKNDLRMPLKIVGVGVSGRFYHSIGALWGRSFSGHFTYSHVVPETITVQDTLRAKVNGFVFSFGYGTSVVHINNLFDLDVYSGFNTGRLKFSGNELLRQKNPFFSPKLGLQSRFIVKRLAFTMRCEYEFDVSRSNWRRTLVASENKVNLQKFRQSGVTALLGIGYSF
jgi:hypothetical protein